MAAGSIYWKTSPVLANLDFNDKISYVRVFSTNQPGFFYARNQIVNGNLVPGHWEGVRRTGIPAIPPPLVGPPIPPPPTQDIPIGPHTRLQMVGGDTSITTIAFQSVPQEALWNDVEYNEAGVSGSDYRGSRPIS